MTREITIQRVNPDDLPALLVFSKKTFFDAFYHLNSPADMEAYAAKFFTVTQIQAEYSTPGTEFYFALTGNEIVGYIKLNYGTAQTEFQDTLSLEVERIYVSCYHQNKGIGRHLLNFALSEARRNNLHQIWLGVWEHNHKAINFYKRSGFEIFGQHNFMLGNDQQVDVLMKRAL